MAGIRGMKWAKVNPRNTTIGVTIENLINDYQIKRWAEKNNIHKGQKRLLNGEAWIDSDNKIYNRMGNCIGEIKFNEGYGVNI